MRPILTFTGHALYFIVMPVITPLLLAVYSVLYLVLVYRFLKRYKTKVLMLVTYLKIPVVRFPLKKQYSFIRSKAFKLHW